MRVYPVNASDRYIKLSDLKVEKLGIKKCRCNKIIVSKDNTCACGKEVDAHEKSVVKKFRDNGGGGSKEKWSADKSSDCCVDDGPTDAFGEIIFPGGDDRLAKYARVSNHTDMQTIWTLLFSREYWNMKKPELIISVTGGAKLKLAHSLKETFCKGLVKVARNTNALVTSGGTYNGCMELVGQAFKENSLSVDPNEVANVLGIATWNSIQNNQSLIRDSEKDKGKTHIVEYDLTKAESGKGPKTALLDPNHNHFLLVDTASSAFGDEVPFRANLEKAIAEIGESIDRNKRIPIVVLVVAGGFRTAESISQAVAKGTPCVFLETSGEVADIFSFALMRIEKMIERNKEKPDFDINNFVKDKQFREEIKAKIEKYFKEQFKIDLIMTSLESSVLDIKNLNLLTVCRPFNGVAEIDVAILHALLKKEKSVVAKQEYLQSQLRLALKWNRIDIARNFIFTDENRDKIGSLDEFMINALVTNKIEFVKLFLENGLSLKHFLTNRVLIKLYNDVPKTSPLNRFIQSRTIERCKYFTFKMIGNAIESLLDDFYSHRFAHLALSRIEYRDLQEILNSTGPDGKKIVNNDPHQINHVWLKELDGKLKFPEHELFMFCVLTGWHEMAMMFCSEGRNSICSALIASKIYKDYASFYEDDATLIEMSENFENYACDILQRCYELDREKAEQTLRRKIAEYDNCTSMQAALLAEDLSFIAHPCFQNVLTKVWYSRIEPDVSWTSLIFFTLFPMFSPFLFYSRSKRNEEKRKLAQKIEDNATFSAGNEVENITNSRSQLVDSSHSTKSSNLPSGIRHIKLGVQYILDFLDTPLIKFTYHQTFYIFFLTLFSYVIMCDFNKVNEADPNSSLGLVISIPEIVLIIWVGTFALELFRKYLRDDKKVFKGRLRSFFLDYWNQLDIVSIVLYIVGLVLRFIPDDNCFIAARVFFAVDILFWFAKSLYTYLFWKDLGPKLTMIKQMLFQLVYFLLIVVLFVFAYGVSTHAILFQDSTLDVHLLKNVFFPAFFVIVGEYINRPVLMAAALSQCDDNNAYPYNSCPDMVGSNIVLALFVIYLIFMNILLVNLLIAIFNNTYDEIETASNKIWRFQRYGLVFDYHNKPFLFPPFSIFYYAFLIVKTAYKRIRKFAQSSNKDLKKPPTAKSIYTYLTKNRNPGFVHEFANQIEENRIIKWEKFVTNQLLSSKEYEHREKFDHQININKQKLDVLSSKFDSFFGYETQNLADRMESVDKSLKNVLDVCIRNGSKLK